MTGFSLVPLQMFTIFGMAASALSGILVCYMFLRRIFLGPEAEGVFTLFAILFLLVSVAITGLGIIGEYVGRIYGESKRRPLYVVRERMGFQQQQRSSEVAMTFIQQTGTAKADVKR